MYINKNIATIVQDLITRHITISSAESCSGGLISKMITDVPGCSTIYPGGVCAYSNEMKIKWLNVKTSTLEKHGAVSAETALEMAHGIRNSTNSDYAISTTGIAGPGGGSIEKPVGLVYIAVVGPEYQLVEKLPLNQNIQLTRATIQQQAAEYAFHMLYSALNQHEK